MRIGGLEKCSLIDYPGKITAIVFTIGCNFRCSYCHNPELVESTATVIPEEEIFGFLKKRTKVLDAVTVTGGEPTIHHDILDFLRRIKALGYNVKLDSNGTNPHILQHAIAEGIIDYIAMDIKAPLEHYPNVMQRPVDARTLRESIVTIMESGLEYEFRTTVERSLTQEDDIRGIGEAIKGAKIHYLQKFVPTKTLDLAFMDGSTHTDAEFEHFRTLMEEYVTRCIVRS